MARTAMITAAAFVMSLAGALPAGILLSASASSAPIQVAAAEQKTIFAIENMTCALCPVTVRKAMEGVTGVKSVKIDFDAKTATVVYDPLVATIDAIAAASTNAGYPAHPTQS